MSSFRQTRARTRANGASSAGSHSLSTNQGAYHDPPTADLPGLYPVHDGSYGVNTHMNIDAPRSGRKGKKSGGSINEEEDDEHFSRRMSGREGSRFGMDMNLKKVAERGRKEAEKYTEDDDGPDGSGQEEVEPDPVQPQTQNSDSQLKKEQFESIDQREARAVSDRPRALNDDDERGIDDEYDKLDYQMNVRIPSYKAKFRDDRNVIEKPPYRTVQYSSPDPHALINNRQPFATPLTQTSTFYGVPIGLGSSLASTAYRPISSRSFNAEGQLYADAALKNPQSKPRSQPTPQLNRNPVVGQQERHNPKPVDTNTNDINNPNPDTDDADANDGTNNANSNSNLDPDPEPNAIPNPTHPTSTSAQFGFNQKPTYRNGNSTVIPEGLTADEWREVNETIDGLRPSPRETSDKPPAPIPSLNHLTLEEIEAAKDLVSDMGHNPVEVLRIEAALNEAAKNPAPPRAPENPIINLFGDTPRETPVVPENTAERENGADVVDFEYDNTNLTEMNQFIKDHHRVELDDADDEDDEDDEDHEDHEEDHDSVFDTIPQPIKMSTFSRNYRGRRRLPKKLASGNYWWNTAVLFLLILGSVWGTLTAFSGGLPTPQLPRVNIVPSINLPGLHDVADRVCRVIPCNISIPPRNWRREKGLNNENLTDAQSKLVKQLTPKIPPQVFVETDKNGKAKITQDFWHALRYLIKEDDIMLTLENAKNDAPEISDAHWLAIKSRLERNGFGSGVEHAMNGSEITRFWDNWVNQNQKSLKKAIGGITIPRDEFMALLKSEVQSFQEEIRKELVAQDARVQELADTLNKLERPKTKDNDSRLTRQEVKAISDAAVRKAIENAKLDALATGRIRGHANDMFLNQVNFFGIGSGAVVDPNYTSKPWKPAKDHFKFRSKNWYYRDGYVNLPPTAALSPWTEEGECYCSGRTVKGEPQIMNSIHVLTSREIIPQHLVVEHILPGSTLDPESMPKDIEVWAYIEEVALREEVRAFSESHFPAKEKETDLNEGYVKIGQFVYENKNYGDGIQIFKLSDELAKMGAWTEFIVVRAVSNYGSDHTCFYRLRMYGDVVENARWEEWERKA